MGKLLSKSATGRTRAGGEPAGEPVQAEVQEALEDMRKLARVTLATQEGERRRVARELHDSVTQILASAQFRLEQLDEDLAARDAASWREVLKCKVLVEKAIQEVRRICRNLRPPELDDLGLAAAVRSLCQDFTERTGVPVELGLGEVPRSAGSELELHLYRIIQEALRNVEKHARAKKVFLSIAQAGACLQVVIRDDGRGFSDANGKPEPPGMGLRDMRERAAFLGGTCVWKSERKRGTEILVEVPLGESENNSTEAIQQSHNSLRALDPRAPHPNPPPIGWGEGKMRCGVTPPCQSPGEIRRRKSE